jgi:hypothetical protein
MDMNAPVITPPPPIPATIRPKMSISLPDAVAEITFPISNTKIESRKVLFSGK